jgi:hypothetical protein
MSEEPISQEDRIIAQKRFEQDLEHLRSNPVFRRTILAELKSQFLTELSAMGEAQASDAEKHRGVVVFIANHYEALAGEPIVGAES